MWAISRETHQPNKQHSVNNNKETFTGQSSHHKCGEGKVEKYTVAHDVADKCKIGRRNQIQQTVHKPWAATTSSKIWS